MALGFLSDRLDLFRKPRERPATVIGDTVNTAQRLQSATKPCQILLNERVFEQVKTAFDFRKIGEVVLKNKVLPAIVYEVMRAVQTV